MKIIALFIVFGVSGVTFGNSLPPTFEDSPYIMNFR